MKGLVRFHSTLSVQRATEKFHTEEIVVQDVGVMIKVLESETPVAEKPFTRTISGTSQVSYKGSSTTNNSHPIIDYESRDNIGYPDGSLGGRSKRSNHSRDHSNSQASTSSVTSAGPNSSNRRKLPQ